MPINAAGMQGVTSSLAAFVASIGGTAMAPLPMGSARRHLLDTLGVLSAGSTQRVAKVTAGYVGSSALPRGATVVGHGHQTDAASAALANGAAAHALDFDDVSWRMGHPSAVVLPAVLAVSEREGASVSEALRAYVVGVEVGAKLGAAMASKGHYEKGWHRTSTLGSVAAAAGVANLLGLGEIQCRNALAIAASSACGIRQNFGSDVKPLHAGFAARNGVTAADLASHGLDGDEAALEGPVGFMNAFSSGAEPAGSSNSIDDTLGNPWDVQNPGIMIKVYPSCGSTHNGIAAALELCAGNDIGAVDVERVSVHVSPVTPSILSHSSPATGLQAKFSMEYCVARAVVDGHVTLEDFDDARISEPLVRDLSQRIDVVVDSSIPNISEIGSASPVRVELSLRGGAKVAKTCTDPPGSPDNVTMDQITGKVRRCFAFGGMGESFEEVATMALDGDDGLGVVELMRRMAPALDR